MSQIKLQRRQPANKMPNDNSNSAEKHSTLSSCFNRRLLRALPFFAVLCAGLVAFAAPSLATAASAVITTYAGGPGPGPTPALSLGQHPNSVAVRDNLVYISDSSNLVIRVLDTTNGQETVVAGNGTPGFSGDGGPATSAQLNFNVAGVAVDSAGNIYVADPAFDNLPGGSSRVRKISTSGVITTVAGNGTPGFSGDGGPATSAQLNEPHDVAVDPSGNLYIADLFNQRIRKVDPSGIITTVVGTGVAGFSGDGGPATDAQISFPNGLTLDRAGNLYIADSVNNRIRKVDGSGTITTVAGNGRAGFSGDGGPATQAKLYQPTDVAADRFGNFFILDSLLRVRKVDTAGIINTVAGNGTAGFSGDGGPATLAQINISRGLAVDAAGQLYIADSNNSRVRRVDTAGIINTVAGNGSAAFSGDGGPKKLAQMAFPEGIAVGPNGSLYISDLNNHRIRKVDSNGNMTTVAGNSDPAGGNQGGFGGDGGPATSALLNFPRDAALDREGNLYIADTDNNRIRKVNTAGIITTVVGTGTAGFRGDGGPATAAQINAPRGVEVDAGGQLFICDTGNAVVRKVTTSGIITTVAGIGGTPGNSGDGGPATVAQINSPYGVALDAIGNFYIADFINANVRKVDTSGIITTVAGTGVPGFSGDGGPATAAQLLDPSGIVVDWAGNLYIADTFNNRVRKVDTFGIIRTIAGTGPTGNTQGGFGGDGGPAREALLNAPIGLALDSFGNLYISDAINNRIRQIQRRFP